MKKKLQVDEMALVFIVAVIALAAAVLEKASHPETEAKKIKDMLLDDHELSLVEEGVIEDSRLDKIKDTSYKDLKSSLDAKNDFCLYIEDENGNVILAKGSSRLGNDGIPCRE